MRRFTKPYRTNKPSWIILLVLCSIRISDSRRRRSDVYTLNNNLHHPHHRRPHRPRPRLVGGGVQWKSSNNSNQNGKRLDRPRRFSNLLILHVRGGGSDGKDSRATPPPPPIHENVQPNPQVTNHHHHHFRSHHPRIALYKKCAISVLVWITTGTIFYSIVSKHSNNNNNNNPQEQQQQHWSLATSFFYAVDAGMSIGFCIPEIHETTIISRAFSIVFILIGASVVGGALALLVSDVLVGASREITAEYRVMLEKEAFRRYDTDGDGVVTRDEMLCLLRSMGYAELVSDDDDTLGRICDDLFFDNNRHRHHHHNNNNRSDNQNNGKERGGGRIAGITVNDFVGTFQKIDDSIHKHTTLPSHYEPRRSHPNNNNNNNHNSNLNIFTNRFLKQSHTLYLVFTTWITIGVLWAMHTQKWDVITATHFAVSALATGGLTAPPVDPQNGSLPTSTAVFVGVYCLLGIPLFYCVMGRYAKTLVSKNLLEVERYVAATPLQPYEYDMVARSLCSPGDEFVHLSDFMVLHFLRRGSTDVDTVRLVKHQFDALDLDKDGVLTFDEATQGLERFYGSTTSRE